ncbi:MAG: response regulator [Fimbriimonadaceae bacterium]|nr:response regulator [Fimbriimonadaceae bacterium]QYK56292.1 MAG: response regulator [Fimbriimonadaceae bacterium]
MRVLIADDDPIIRLDLKQMLENLGYEVVDEAEDGAAAVEKARALRPDVCVMDVKMPNMDGIKAAATLTDENVTPVVLLTAYSDRELVEQAKEAGVFGYLVKPFKPGDLAPAIEVARARFEQNQQLLTQVTDLNERIEARKAVERAKGVLMEKHGISEAEAYRRIQTQSMNQRVSMREVADAVLMAKDV